MLDQEMTHRTVTTEYTRLIEIVAEADERLPVLDGWTMSELAAHCDTAMEQQAESFRRGAVGRMDPTALEVSTKAKGERLASMRAQVISLADSIRSLTPDQVNGMTPLPFGVVPTMVAMQVAGLEAGFHRFDAEVAIDGGARLTEPVIGALFAMVPGLAPMLAAGTWGTPSAPTTPMGYQLRGSNHMIDLSFTGSEWIPAAAEAGETTTISGDDEALALFFMGRRTLDHASLTVQGNPITAEAFKRYFPGP